MRFELAGSLIHPDPVVLTYTFNQNFDTVKYLDLGYTHFEVICIGGGGGAGGNVYSGTGLRCYGGAGGGGGYHRVRGLLSALPALCATVVGAGGGPGVTHTINPALTTNGGDGGASTFNGITCRASGGEGGKRVQSNVLNSTTFAHGGAGGAGNRSNPGGGGIGGVAGVPNASGTGTPTTNGADGTLFNNVGKGGGGGAGGVDTIDGITNLLASSGGRGSYNPGDTSVYGPGESPPHPIIAGRASGAKASPLNGLPTVYGRSGNEFVGAGQGVVIIRMTVE